MLKISYFSSSELQIELGLRNFERMGQAAAHTHSEGVGAQKIVHSSVGSNPKITNFELLRTLEVELRTLSNPGLPTKTELRTHPNPPKIPNSEPTNPTVLNILEKSMNFELLRTLEVELRTLPNPS